MYTAQEAKRQLFSEAVEWITVNCLPKGQMLSGLRIDYGFSNIEVTVTLNKSGLYGEVEGKILFGMGLRKTSKTKIEDSG